MSGTTVRGIEVDRLTPGDLSGFKKRVKDAALHLANECGVKFRVLDGGHVRFYPPGPDQPVFKISASRPEEDTVRFIEKFKRVNGIEEQIKVGLTTSVGQALVEAGQALADVVERRPEEATMEHADPQAEALPAEEWVRHLTAKGEESPYAETNGVIFRCIACHHEDPDVKALLGHWMGKHHRVEPAPRTEETKARISRKRNTTNLFNNLAALGITPPVDRDSEKDEARIAKLEADLEAMKQRAETAEARLALILEAAKA